MQTANTPSQWGAIHQAFHWTIGILVISQIIVGLWFSGIDPKDPARGEAFALHASLGLTLLLLMLARLVWRLRNPVPELPDTLSPGQKRLARATHWLFYILVIGLPAGAYLAVSARGRPVPFWGLELPGIIGKNDALADFIMAVHVAGAWALIALILLHVAAALRHEFILKDNTLRRMTPLPLRAEANPASVPGRKVQ